MGEFDYREVLKDCEELDDYYEDLMATLDEEQAASWTLLQRDKMQATFISYDGEIRVVGAPYIDKMFSIK